MKKTLICIGIIIFSIQPAMTHAASCPNGTQFDGSCCPDGTTGDGTMCNITSGSVNNPGTSGSVTNPGTSGSVTNPGTSGSVTNPGTGGTFFLQNPLSSNFNTVGGLISGFLQIFTYLVIIAGVLMIIYVGLRFVLAMGNTDEIKKRKEQMLWLVIGLAIVIGARVLVTVVLNTLSATGTVSPGIINSANNAINQVSQ